MFIEIENTSCVNNIKECNFFNYHFKRGSSFTHGFNDKNVLLNYYEKK